jgi:hypothetical protein
VDNLFFAFIYFVIIIVFAVIKLRKKKGSGRKPWSPRDSSGGERPRISGNAGPAQRRPGGGDSALPGFLKELLSGEDGASAGADSAEEDIVEAAWRKFRSESTAEPEAAFSPRPEKEKPAAPRPFIKAFVPAETAESPGGEPPAGMVSAFFRPEETSAGAALKPSEAALPAAGGQAAGGGKAAEAGEDFSARLARLSPLQRAFVMAEVLGKPRALRPGEEL